MATIITDGGGWQDSLYENNHTRDETFLHSLNERARMFETSLTGNARRLYDDMPDSQRMTFDVDEYVTRARRNVTLARADVSRIDVFAALTRLEHLQRPPRMMMPYILAHPTLAKEHRAGRLQGYDLPVEKQYANPTESPFYQQAMVGVAREVSDGVWERTVSRLDISVGKGPQVRTLDHWERQAVLKTWDSCMAFHHEGHDVTSPGGGMR